MCHVARLFGTVLTFACGAAGQSLVIGPPLPAGYRGQAGDVDGDGQLDYLGTSGAQISVHSGATGAALSLLARPLATGTDEVGYVPVGDVNADGKDDLAYYKSSLAGANFVTIVSGADGSTLHSWNLPAPAAPAVPVSGGADYDADGFSDVVIGYRTTQNFELQVRSGRSGGLLLQQTYANTGTAFFSIGPIGDHNGDGYDDVAVYASYFSLNVTTASVGEGPDFVNWFPIGANVSPLGDVNGNGTDDFFRGQSSAFEIVDGTGATLWTSSLFYLRAWGLGDLDGDGAADVLLNDYSMANTCQVLSGRTVALLPGVAPTGNAFPIGDIDHDGRGEAWHASGRYEWSDPALPVASRMVRRGVAGTTSTGRRPRIKTRGNTGLGHQLFFDLRGALPNGITLLAAGPAIDVDLTPFGAPGNRAFADLQAAWLLPTDANGLARYQVAMATTTALLGVTTTVQCVVLDAAANALGLVTSDAYDIETRN